MNTTEDAPPVARKKRLRASRAAPIQIPTREELKNKEFEGPRTLDWDTITALGVEAEFKDMISKPWDRFF